MNGDQVKEQGVWSERLSQGPGLHSFAFHQSFFFSLRGETSDNKTEENETERRGVGSGEGGGVVVENMMG